MLLLLNVLLFGMWRLLSSNARCLHPHDQHNARSLFAPAGSIDIPGGGPGGHFSLFDSLMPVARGDRSRLEIGSPRSTRPEPSAVGRTVLVSHLRVRQLGRRRRRCARLVGQSRNMLATTLRAVAVLSALAVVHGASARGPR